CTALQLFGFHARELREHLPHHRHQVKVPRDTSVQLGKLPEVRSWEGRSTERPASSRERTKTPGQREGKYQGQSPRDKNEKKSGLGPSSFVLVLSSVGDANQQKRQTAPPVEGFAEKL